MTRFFLLIIAFFPFYAHASGLKVFGKEFCTPYDAGTCINFSVDKVRDSRTLLGAFKHPKGREAHLACMKNADSTDASLAICAMIFHRAEQTDSQRNSMCSTSTRRAYSQLVRDPYPIMLYDNVWNCR